MLQLNQRRLIGNVCVALISQNKEERLVVRQAGLAQYLGTTRANGVPPSTQRVPLCTEFLECCQPDLLEILYWQNSRGSD